MASLFFPQLASGALAQFPIRKTRLARTVKNVLQDGSLVLFSDPTAGHLVWQLAYADLSSSDMSTLQSFFTTCCGPFHAFTFIDPTDNLFSYSSDLRGPAWQTSSLIQIASGAADPEGGTAGFTVTNTAQANQEIGQSLTVPANYQYCFSLYALSAEPAELVLTRQGSSSATNDLFAVGPTWTRIVSSGRLNEEGTTLTAGIILAPGQQVSIYGLQLEPQIAPSRYRPTTQNGGVYANAHWAMDELTFTAEAPNLFSISFSIETAI